MIASGDDEVSEYIIAWMADCVQNPVDRPGTSGTRPAGFQGTNGTECEAIPLARSKCPSIHFQDRPRVRSSESPEGSAGYVALAEIGPRYPRCVV